MSGKLHETIQNLELSEISEFIEDDSRFETLQTLCFSPEYISYYESASKSSDNEPICFGTRLIHKFSSYIQENSVNFEEKSKNINNLLTILAYPFMQRTNVDNKKLDRIIHDIVDMSIIKDILKILEKIMENKNFNFSQLSIASFKVDMKGGYRKRQSIGLLLNHSLKLLLKFSIFFKYSNGIHIKDETNETIDRLIEIAKGIPDLEDDYIIISPNDLVEILNLIKYFINESRTSHLLLNQSLNIDSLIEFNENEEKILNQCKDYLRKLSYYKFFHDFKYAKWICLLIDNNSTGKAFSDCFKSIKSNLEYSDDELEKNDYWLKSLIEVIAYLNEISLKHEYLRAKYLDVLNDLYLSNGFEYMLKNISKSRHNFDKEILEIIFSLNSNQVNDLFERGANLKFSKSTILKIINKNKLNPTNIVTLLNDLPDQSEREFLKLVSKYHSYFVKISDSSYLADQLISNQIKDAEVLEDLVLCIKDNEQNEYSLLRDPFYENHVIKIFFILLKLDYSQNNNALGMLFNVSSIIKSQKYDFAYQIVEFLTNNTKFFDENSKNHRTQEIIRNLLSSLLTDVDRIEQVLREGIKLKLKFYIFLNKCSSNVALDCTDTKKLQELEKSLFSYLESNIYSIFSYTVLDDTIKGVGFKYENLENKIYVLNSVKYNKVSGSLQINLNDDNEENKIFSIIYKKFYKLFTAYEQIGKIEYLENKEVVDDYIDYFFQKSQQKAKSNDEYDDKYFILYHGLLNYLTQDLVIEILNSYETQLLSMDLIFKLSFIIKSEEMCIPLHIINFLHLKFERLNNNVTEQAVINFIESINISFIHKNEQLNYLFRILSIYKNFDQIISSNFKLNNEIAVKITELFNLFLVEFKKEYKFLLIFGKSDITRDVMLNGGASLILWILKKLNYQNFDKDIVYKLLIALYGFGGSKDFIDNDSLKFLKDISLSTSLYNYIFVNKKSFGSLINNTKIEESQIRIENVKANSSLEYLIKIHQVLSYIKIFLISPKKHNEILSKIGRLQARVDFYLTLETSNQYFSLDDGFESDLIFSNDHFEQQNCSSEKPLEKNFYNLEKNFLVAIFLYRPLEIQLQIIIEGMYILKYAFENVVCSKLWSNFKFNGGYDLVIDLLDKFKFKSYAYYNKRAYFLDKKVCYITLKNLARFDLIDPTSITVHQIKEAFDGEYDKLLLLYTSPVESLKFLIDCEVSSLHLYEKNFEFINFILTNGTIHWDNVNPKKLVMFFINVIDYYYKNNLFESKILSYALIFIKAIINYKPRHRTKAIQTDWKVKYLKLFMGTLFINGYDLLQKLDDRLNMKNLRFILERLSQPGFYDTWRFVVECKMLKNKMENLKVDDNSDGYDFSPYRRNFFDDVYSLIKSNTFYLYSNAFLFIKLLENDLNEYHLTKIICIIEYATNTKSMDINQKTLKKEFADEFTTNRGIEALFNAFNKISNPNLIIQRNTIFILDNLLENTGDQSEFLNLYKAEILKFKNFNQDHKAVVRFIENMIENPVKERIHFNNF